MRIWVIEDELPAARRMVNMLQSIEGVIVEKTFATVLETVAALQQLQHPELLVMDIHLADGSSFEIFKQVQVNAPVIFTTAFDQYALNAFKLNSIDYLLKPIKEEELHAAIEKFKRLHNQQLQTKQIEQLLKVIGRPPKEYKRRFAVKYGEHLKTIDINQVAYFFTENKATYLIGKDGFRHVIDYNMDELDEHLDPRNFFRINRQFIISVAAISEMHTYTKARVMVTLNPPTKLDTIVSSERAAAFKQWLDGIENI
ncbi:LytTR family DNA-binding domain-containing protein [soil metagenome]